MAKEKVTVQDIADELGISRNTASKALNGSDMIPEETRKKVIKKAIELKYKQFAWMDQTIFSKKTGNIALFTANLPNTSHFGSAFISGLEKHISSKGYTLSFHIVRAIDQEMLTLPKNFDASNVDGIICIELFDLNYSNLITKLELPTIFVDCTATICFPDFRADILLMENEHSIYQLTKTFIENGYDSFGFVGDFTHCLSFHERWIGFNRALIEAKIPLDFSQCIVEDDSRFLNLTDWMEDRLQAFNKLPSAFICANDFIAVNLMKALKNMNVTIPHDVAICGFDNGPESTIVDPPLSTVHIFSKEMGIKAAELLFTRIKNPDQPYQITHVFTEPIIRESTPLKNNS